MFAALYVNGHLVTIAFSLTMVLAFLVSALRIQGQRDDYWMVMGFMFTGALGVVEMVLCLAPSLVLARAHLVFGGALLFIVAMGVYLRYGRDLRDQKLRKRIGAWIWGYGVLTVVICGLVGIGWFERPNQTRVVSLWGVHVTM